MVQSSGELSYVWFGFISISLFFTFSWRVEAKETRKSKDDPIPGKCLVGDKPIALAITKASMHPGAVMSASCSELQAMNRPPNL